MTDRLPALPAHPWRTAPAGWEAAEVAAIRSYAAAAIAQALEEAAKRCEVIAENYQRSDGQLYPELKTDAQTGASDCEAAIRALKEAYRG